MDALQPPQVRVNETVISASAIAAEMQYHPAPNLQQAWHEAATALVVRELLHQEADRLGVVARDDDDDSEETLFQALLAREVTIPTPDDETCRRYWAANRDRFRGGDVYEAAHILFAAPPEDKDARDAARRGAEETLALVLADPARFAALARERSGCPSGAQGGLLGQQSRGDLVPEFETFVLALEEGQICPVPVETRYGFHILRLDRLVHGERLPFDAASPRIADHLRSHAWQRAVSQYLRILAGRARIEGVAIDGAASPLVQ